MASRLLGSQATIQITQNDGSVISVGEVDKFTSKELSDVMKSQALGQGEITSQVVFKGFDLEFEGGLIDFQVIEDIMTIQSIQTALRNRSPYFTVIQTLRYFDGTEVKYTYRNVSLSEYSLDASSAEEQIKQSFKGFSGSPKEKTGTPIPATTQTIFDALLSYTAGEEGRTKLKNQSNADVSA